ncbi:MAG: DsbA family protein, partial [Nitrospirota bacterium]|nr:DsbA family protein [Nitrospirota bacterium]
MRRHLFNIPIVVIFGLGLIMLAIPVFAKAPEFLIQDDDVVRGDPKAPITLVEYSDFTCHFCQKF